MATEDRMPGTCMHGVVLDGPCDECLGFRDLKAIMQGSERKQIVCIAALVYVIKGESVEWAWELAEQFYNKMPESLRKNG